ncbi:hypothetical protein VB319_22060 [Vibrio parahaemolyticus]|uniref:hypothetical protein n=1 Tax=Vibrio TaxID=662 RepID=UPI000E329E74|nr:MULTISPECIES: hypothetical protein [Vibrio]MCA2471615.1 hypothetical protein [Vibrio alginolyticus]HAT8518383.1 hypothetical protein [Vibrio vulnificus]MDW2151635.1 hypothetical protein [Vibrio sp. 2092]MEA5356666.1 hypothetical protein [Vibrio parahaemolyticus]RFD37525.1 hypothetical protein BS585_16360 [Vibrio parahaemolyticus]
MRVRYTLNLYTDKKLDSEIADYIAEHPKGMERSEAIRTLIKVGYNTLIRHMDSQQAVEHSVNENDLKMVVEMLSGIMKKAPATQQAPQTSPDDMFRMMQMFEMMRGGANPANQQSFPSPASYPYPYPPHMMPPGMNYPESDHRTEVRDSSEQREMERNPHPPASESPSDVRKQSDSRQFNESVREENKRVQESKSISKNEENINKSNESQVIKKEAVKPVSFDEEIIDPDLMIQNEEEGFVGFDLGDGESDVFNDDDDDDDFIDPLEMLGAKFGG